MTNKVIPVQITNAENGALVFLMSNGKVLRYSGASWSEIKIPQNLLKNDDDSGKDLLTEG